MDPMVEAGPAYTPCTPCTPARLVTVTTSLGGMHAIEQMLATIPLVFPTPIVIAHHMPDAWASYLADLLGTRTDLPVRWATHMELLKPGHVYVGPPGFHLGVTKYGRAQLSGAPRHNFVRPSGDLLFQSAAARFGAGCIAVVLSGRLTDGAAGVRAMRAAGAVVIAQAPASAEAPGMPNAAIATGGVDFVLPPRAIGAALVSLAMVPGATELFGVGAHRRVVAA